jgi:hypothetical protein
VCEDAKRSKEGGGIASEKGVEKIFQSLKDPFKPKKRAFRNKRELHLARILYKMI